MGARKGAAARPCGESHPGRLRDLKARAPTAQSERREGPGLIMPGGVTDHCGTMPSVGDDAAWFPPSSESKYASAIFRATLSPISN